jgi:8-oxo-dGTP diphosphatase
MTPEPRSRYSYEYPRPALAVDCVIFGYDSEELRVLLIQRDLPPFAGEWALPGGFVRMEESLEASARRELAEETGVSGVYLEQLYTFSDPDRDPRERVVSVAHYALVDLVSHPVEAATDARRAAWFTPDDLPPLAFDHDAILAVAQRRLQAKVRYQPIGFELLPEKFTLTQLQRLYEKVLQTSLDKRNFRKKVLAMDLLVALEEVEEDVAHRAARLYRFDEAKYRALSEQGFHFEI